MVPNGAGNASHGQSGAGGSGAQSGNSGTGAPGSEELGDDQPAPTTRAARLTHAQWDRTINDLFYLDGQMTFSSLLRADPVQSGFVFDNNVLTLSVDEALVGGYERAAADIAELVTSDAALLSRIAPANANAAVRAETFVRDFGLRAHRRPLSQAEQDEYLTLFTMGPTLYTGLDDFEAGARLVLEAMLQSPFFLYRIEDSDQADGDLIPLDSYEIAARLSYTLWGSMPDQGLFDAAANDELLDPAALATQARRLLADARAEVVIEDFHRQLFSVERFEGIHPSDAFFPDAPDDLGASALTELEMFVRDVVLERKGSFADLMTSNETFVNADLAELYGLSGDFNDTFEKVALDTAERRGILTQIGFLASHATSVNPDPIHRGVFIARRVACAQIAAPPADIPPLPTPPPGQTNRKTIEDLTQDPDTICSSCHSSIINPFGFPFESYDATGAYRTQDQGQPVDTRTSPLIGGQTVMVNDAVQLVDQLAQSQAVHECYVKHWLEYAYARPEAEQDAVLLARLAGASLGDDLAIEDLIVGLVTSPSFTARSAEELP